MKKKVFAFLSTHMDIQFQKIVFPSMRRISNDFAGCFLLSPFMLLDSFFTYYFKYKPELEHNVIICDRYFYDKVARIFIL